MLINTFLKNVIIFNNKTVSQIRFYPRWSHRRPLKVYTSEEYEKIQKKDENVPQYRQETISDFPTFIKNENSKINWEQSKPLKQDTVATVDYKMKPKKYAKPLIATYQKNAQVEATDMFETVINSEGNFIYTKMKDSDQRIGMILSEVKSKKQKSKNDLLLLEGKRLIKDALLAGCNLKYILFSRKNEIEYLKSYLPKVGASLYKMPYREMQMWSDLTTNPGIMGIFKIPNVEQFKPKDSLPFTLICDNIREPGNLGTILRICAGVGCERIILTKGCVNLWDCKVLRSAVGAHFKLNIQKNLEWNQIEKEISEDSNIFIADNKIIHSTEENNVELKNMVEKIPIVPYYSVAFKKTRHTILIVGGETLGISRKSYEIVHRFNGARLNIPLNNDVDSLNVGTAFGIIAFELKKQLVQNL